MQSTYKLTFAVGVSNRQSICCGLQTLSSNNTDSRASTARISNILLLFFVFFIYIYIASARSVLGVAVSVAADYSLALNEVLAPKI
jgi:hypothetical protein